MDRDPSTAGRAPLVPAVVDELEPTLVRTPPAGSRDEEFLEFVRASGRYLLRTALLLCGDPAPGGGTGPGHLRAPVPILA